MSKEAMKLALEALNNTYALRDDVIQAIKALEEALAKQEQGEPDDEEVLGFNGWGFPIEPPPKQEQGEPVGEVVVESMGVCGSDAMQIRLHFYKEIPPVGSKIYITPQPKQEVKHD